MDTKELVAGLEQAWGGVLDLLGTLGPQDWAKPTPCEGWDMKDLAAHLGGVEGFFQGFPQPEPPPAPTSGIDDWTGNGVRARRGWPPEDVVGEVQRASAAQLERLRGLDDEGWQQPTMGPLGETTMAGLADIRLFDVYVHLLDLRTAVGRPIDGEAEPVACALAAEQVFEHSGWGAVKKAGLPDGSRVRLDLSGPGGRTVDVRVDDGRGALSEPDGGSGDRVDGTALAYLLLVAGRPSMAEAAGGVRAGGETAERFLERYRIFQ